MSVVKYCELYEKTFADAKSTGVVDPFPCAVDAVVEQAKADERARLAGEGPTDDGCAMRADVVAPIQPAPRDLPLEDRLSGLSGRCHAGPGPWRARWRLYQTLRGMQ